MSSQLPEERSRALRRARGLSLFTLALFGVVVVLGIIGLIRDPSSWITWVAVLVLGGFAASRTALRLRRVTAELAEHEDDDR